MGCEGVDWINLAQISNGGCTKHDNESWGVGEFYGFKEFDPLTIWQDFLGFFFNLEWKSDRR
jgi:hypothetical protein